MKCSELSINCTQNESNSGGVCRKCWCNVDAFHRFYLLIEEIHGLDFKTEYAEPLKCEVSAYEINDDSQFFAHCEAKQFDNMSDSDNNFFENDGN